MQWAWMRRGRDVRSAGSSGGGELGRVCRDAFAARPVRARRLGGRVRRAVFGALPDPGPVCEKSGRPAGVVRGDPRSVPRRIHEHRGAFRERLSAVRVSGVGAFRCKTGPLQDAVRGRRGAQARFGGFVLRAGRPRIVADDDAARDASDVGVALALQKHVWPLFVARGVDVYVAGHNHAYQRHCAFAGVANGSPNSEPNGSPPFTNRST